MKRNYVLPRIEILEVKIEKGFAVTGSPAKIETTIDTWQEYDIQYDANAIKDNSGFWGDIDW